MSETTPNKEPITPEEMAVVEERFIKTQVATFSQAVADQKIDEARAYCAPLIIAGIEDKEGYKKVDNARKAIKKYRTSVEGKRKELNDFPKRFTEAVNAEAKRLTALLVPIEEEQERKLAVIDNQKAAIEAERKRLRDELQLKREQELRDLGLVQSDTFFVLGSCVISRSSIGDMSPEAWSEQLRLAKVASDKDIAQKAEIASLKHIAEKAAANKAQEASPTIEHNSNEPAPFVPANPQHTPTPPPVTNKKDDMFTSFPTPKPNVNVTISDYKNGFEDCRNQVINLFNDPTPRKRADFIQAFKELQPKK